MSRRFFPGFLANSSLNLLLNLSLADFLLICFKTGCPGRDTLAGCLDLERPEEDGVSELNLELLLADPFVSGVISGSNGPIQSPIDS